MKSFGLNRARWIVLLLLFALSAGYQAAAQNFHFDTREASMIRTAGQIKSHDGFFDTIIVRQDKWDEMIANGSNWSNHLKFKSVHAFVKFYVNHDYEEKVPTPYTFRLAYKLYGYSNMSDTNQYTTINDTLTISYDPDSLSTYTDIQVKKYSNFHKIMIVMTGLYEISGAGSPPVPVDMSASGNFTRLNFNVEGSILVQPYYKEVKIGGTYVPYYGTSAPPLVVLVPPTPPHPPYVEVLIHSGASSGLTPIHYELEWTYVDNYSVSPTGNVQEKPSNQLRYNFHHNSTRVWLDTNYYRVPAVYQGGYLVFRARAVRPDSVMFRTPVYGKWTLGEQGSVSSVPATSRYKIAAGHMDNHVNWQYTVSFAEGGKYKHVLSYYDGLLKKRQSITRFNSMPDYLIATASVYDYEGRPSVQILPTPIPTQYFRYQPSLTISSATGLEYGAVDFDELSSGVCPAFPAPPPLADSAEANIYYSSLNPNKSGFHRFVPDAGGYPFTTTVFSAGHDERVLLQGGAGDTLRLGAGHAVKNVYVDQEQADLNRLLGIDAGWSGFYRKTISQDPNGQLSLQVTDYHGKTVAQSMIGIPDTQRLALLPNTNVPDTTGYLEDFIAGAQQQISGNTRILDRNFFNDAAGNSTAQYVFSLAPFPTFCPGKYLSVKAQYAFDIRDACGEVKIAKSGSLGGTGVLSSGAVISAETDAFPFFMQQGKHSIHKITGGRSRRCGHRDQRLYDLGHGSLPAHRGAVY